MFSPGLLPLLLLLAFPFLTTGKPTYPGPKSKSLWLPTTPQSPQPYALKKGAGVTQGYGDTWNIYPVTGNSSGRAFTIMNTVGPSSGGSGVFPHVHMKTHENFYAFKGRVQLWGQDLAGFEANTSVQQSRVLTPGDFGGIPRGNIHTFQLLEPDTLLTGVLVPGGFEEFFFSADLASAGPDAAAGLVKWDVYPQPKFVPRTDLVDNKAGPGNWYDGPNELPAGAEKPIWVAKNHGPRWLTDDGGRYQIVAPLVTGKQTEDMFAQGHITLSPQFEGTGQGPMVRSPVATAFQVEEGQVDVTVEGYATAHLIEGDVVFVPANKSFTYVAEAEFTKFMYVSGGADGIDAMLIRAGKEWKTAFYPRSGEAAHEAPRLRI
jgi:quercetin dioxygenase-like cupin family protein